MNQTLTQTAADADTISRLRYAAVRLVRLLRQHADPNTGLSQSQISTLASVSRCGPVTLGRLAEAERVQPPSMTKIVDQLEGKGLVAREVDPDDRRVARVTLLSPGEKLLAQVRTRKNEYLADRIAELSPRERAALEAALPALEHLASVRP